MMEEEERNGARSNEMLKCQQQQGKEEVHERQREQVTRQQEKQK